MSSPLKQNTATIQELLNTINSLPEAGTDLPELTNEGSAADLLSGKELIDDEGNKVIGAFTIDSELTTQDNLISQIQTALQNKAAATGEDVTSETTAYTSKLSTLETAITALETELQGKASGGSGGVNTVQVTLYNITGYGFDADGNAVNLEPGTYDLFAGIIEFSCPPATILGSYITVPYRNLYRFTTSATVYGSGQGGGGGA